MRKILHFLLSFILLVTGGGIAANADEYTYTLAKGDFSDKVTTHASGNVTWTLTPTWKTANSTSWGFESSNSQRGFQVGSSRKYATAVTLSTSDFTGTITKVVVNSSTNSKAKASISLTVGGQAFGGDAKSLTNKAADYTFGGDASGELCINYTANNAVYIKSVTVTYTASNKVVTHTAFDKGNYTITQKVGVSTITYENPATVSDADGKAVSGATVTYSTSDKDHANVDENGNVTIDPTVAGTYTITATYSGDGTYGESSASYTITVEEDLGLTGDGTEGNPYTVADALTIINKNIYSTKGQGVYVKGVVTSVNSFNSQYKSITYDIADQTGDTNTLDIYSGKNAGGKDFSATTDVAVGDIVLVKGDLNLYNKKAEFDKNNTLEKFFERPMTINETATEKSFAAGHNVTVTLKRTFNNNAWNTLVLPFDVTAEQITSAFGSNAKIAAYSGATANTDNSYTLNFTEATTIAANQPAFIYGVQTNAEGYRFTGVEVKDDTPTQNADGFNFVGTYTKENVPTGNFFINAENKFYKAGDGNTAINATRATFAPANTTASKAKSLGFNISKDGAATAISAITIQDEAGANAPVYNLAGQRVGKAYKGLVLQNGKKLIKK